MGWIAKLVRDNQTLVDLNAGRYGLGLDFVPPGAAEMSQIAGGNLLRKVGQNARWAFSVRVLGANNAEVERGIADLEQALALAGDADHPLFLEWRPSDTVSFEPTWGQWNTNRRVEIVSADSRVLWDYYAVSNLREKGAFITIGTEIRSYSLGGIQRLANSAGGIGLDSVGLMPGEARGLVIPEATTNKMTNPVFGHGTWNNGWTAGAGLIATQNIEQRYKLFGRSSARLLAISGANNTFTQTINVGNTNTHIMSCYVKLPNSGMPDTSLFSLFYGGIDLNATYVAQGNGWYYAWASLTGQNAAVAAGCIIGNSYTVFVDGFQLEEKVYPTLLAYGDMLGCAWTGTAHASTSTRTAGQFNLAADGILSNAQGTAAVVWTPHVASTHPNTMFLWSNSSTSLCAYYLESDDRFYLADGTDAIATAAQTFSAEETIILHFTWSPSGRAIYKNGVLAASTSSYTPAALVATLNIGHSAAIAYHNPATFKAVTFYDRAMSATEVAADYTAMAQIIADGQRVDFLPSLWTKDGDGIADNALDTTYNNYAVVQDVPGIVDAETYISGYAGYAGVSSKYDVWLANWKLDEFLPLAGRLFQDENTIIPPDATLCGTGYTATTLDTTESTLSTLSVQDAEDALAGREIYLFARLYDAGANLQLRFRFSNSSVTIQTDLLAVASSANYRLYKVGVLAPLSIENFKRRWN